MLRPLPAALSAARRRVALGVHAVTVEQQGRVECAAAGLRRRRRRTTVLRRERIPCHQAAPRHGARRKGQPKQRAQQGAGRHIARMVLEIRDAADAHDPAAGVPSGRAGGPAIRRDSSGGLRSRGGSGLRARTGAARRLHQGRVIALLEPYLEHPEPPVRSKAAEWLMIATYRPPDAPASPGRPASARGGGGGYFSSRPASPNKDWRS